MFKEFKNFAVKGNVLDLAVAVIVGGAFSAIVKSMVDDIIMPIVGAVFGNPDFTTITLGPVLIGNFIQSIVNFLIIAFSLFIVVRQINKMKKPVEKAAPKISNEEKLLTEIRDLLKDSTKR